MEIGSKLEIYHKACFRCEDCGLQLELNNYGSLNRLVFHSFLISFHIRVIYCKVHLKNHKGEVDKSKWTSNTSAQPSSFVPETTEGKPSPQKSENSESVGTNFSIMNSIYKLIAAKMKAFRESGDSNKCSVCAKTVYQAEKMDVEIKGQKQVFHKACFKSVRSKLRS